MKMKALSKRVASFLVACATVVAIMPMSLAADPVTWGPYDFENQVKDPAEDRNATVEVVKNPDKSGINASEYAVRATDREANYAGVGFDVSQFKGYEIEVSAKVYLDGDTADEVIATVQVSTPGSGDSYLRVTTSERGSKQWYEIKGTQTIDSSASAALLYFECQTLNDIYVDDVKIVATPLAPSTPAVDLSTLESLKDLYADYFSIGVAVPNSALNNSVYTDLIKQQYNSITSENEAKPDSLIDIETSKSEPEKYQESPAVKLDGLKQVLEFCRANGIKYRLHTLVWHNQTPDAFFHVDYDTSKPLVSKDVMNKRLESYIKQVFEFCNEYDDVIYAADIVNEVASAALGIKDQIGNVESKWADVYGEDDYSFVTNAFAYARQHASPNIKLYYNDYGPADGFDQANPSASTGKTALIVDILKDAKAAGNIDGIGMQGHLGVSYTDAEKYVACGKYFSDLGYDVQITELDIQEDGDAVKQSQLFYDLFKGWAEAVKEGYNFSNITFWGLSDDLSWKRANNPLIFKGTNDNLQPKDSFYALVELGNELKYGSIRIDFEDQDLHGAQPREFGETVQIAANPDKSGINTSDYVVQVTNRGVGTTDPYAGVKFDISEFIDKRITVTAKVYMSGDINAQVKANIEQIAGGASQYATIVSSPDGKGTWYEITGTFDVPSYLDEAWLYFETSRTTNDFYVDDVKIVGSESQLSYVDYSDLESLKDLYSDYFLVGVGTPYALVKSEDHSGLIKQQYNSLTNENEAKPENLIDINACIEDPEKYNESPAVTFDKIKATLDFCQANGIKYRLHTLVWHSQTPAALFHEGYDVDQPMVSRELMEKRLENYIKQILEWCDANYPGVVYAVDVVNEARDVGTGSNWYKAFGKSYDYITKAFEYADKYAPDYMKLYYNDYNAADTNKQKDILNLLKDAKAAGTVDGIGMQSHLGWYTNISDHIQAVKEYCDAGYDVQITELDIEANNGDFNTQKQQYVDLFRGLVEAKKEGYSISSVTIWAVSDNFSWKNWNSPVLFNADLSTKPAFDGLVELGREYQLEDAKEALNNKIAELEQLDSALYTEDSYAAFKAELDRVKSEASGSLTLEDAESLLAALETAETGLVTKLDAAKEELNNKIAELEAIDLSGYTEESAAAFRAALALVKSTADDPGLTVEAIESLLIDLEKAKNDLVEATDPTDPTDPTEGLIKIIKGNDGTWTQNSKDGLSFTSNAEFDDFLKVMVDGKDLDPSNYTVAEGSTVVTLKADYLATLSVGKHTIAIVSKSGTAGTTFTINAAESGGDVEESTKTGGSNNLFGCIVLLFVTSAGALGAVAYSKKKRAGK